MGCLLGEAVSDARGGPRQGKQAGILPLNGQFWCQLGHGKTAVRMNVCVRARSRACMRVCVCSCARACVSPLIREPTLHFKFYPQDGTCRVLWPHHNSEALESCRAPDFWSEIMERGPTPLQPSQYTQSYAPPAD